MAEAPAADTLFLALDRRSGEADSETEEQPLTQEIEKVRGTLRSNLVPEARALVSDKMVEDMLRAPLIWLLASGSKMDHLSIAALGAALQRAGYRVKVFGAGCFERIFARLGLAFEAHDAHPLMHRHNLEARRWLSEFSDSVEMKGPGKEDDLFFDLHVLRLEHTCALSTRRAAEKDSDQSGFAVAAVLSEHRFNDLFIRSDCSDGFKQWIGERWLEVLSWRATDRRRSVENWGPVHGTHIRSFRDFMRQKAEELGFDRVDIIETLRFEFVKSLAKLMEQAAREGRDASTVLRHEVADFLAWLNGESPREWWQRWTAKLSAWIEEIPHVRTSQHTVLTMAVAPGACGSCGGRGEYGWSRFETRATAPRTPGCLWRLLATSAALSASTDCSTADSCFGVVSSRGVESSARSAPQPKPLIMSPLFGKPSGIFVGGTRTCGPLLSPLLGRWRRARLAAGMEAWKAYMAEGAEDDCQNQKRAAASSYNSSAKKTNDKGEIGTSRRRPGWSGHRGPSALAHRG